MLWALYYISTPENSKVFHLHTMRNAVFKEILVRILRQYRMYRKIRYFLFKEAVSRDF